jgi:hypothetical protein
MDDNALIHDIRRAQAYLKTRFQKSEDDDNLLHLDWAVEFPELDRAEVSPVLLGQKMEGVTSAYRLVWTSIGLLWKSEGLAIRNAFGLPNIAVSIVVPEEDQVEKRNGKRR